MNTKSNTNRKILLVDDDIEVHRLFEKVLTDKTLPQQITLSFETSGANALSSATRLSPDLILLDLSMPNVDGFEVMRQIQTNYATAAIPVICMSGDGTSATRARVHELGAVGFIQKPVDPRTLSQDLNALYASINSLGRSQTGSRTFMIAFNASEKYRLLKAEIAQVLANSVDVTVALLTLDNGERLMDPAMTAWVDQKRLVILQANPALIAKFPFIQDLSPVLADFRGFIGSTPDKTVMFFDDFQLFLNTRDSQAALSRFLQVREDFAKICQSMHFFSTRTAAKDEMQTLNQISEVMCR